MDCTTKILGKESVKWEGLAAFRKRHNNIAAQALQYAMKHDLVDYIKVGPKASAILLTEKTLAYSPKSNPARSENNAG